MFSKTTNLNKFNTKKWVAKDIEKKPVETKLIKHKTRSGADELVNRLIKMEHVKAIKILAKQENSKSIKLSMANCFNDKEEYDNALRILYTIPRYDRDPIILSTMKQTNQKKEALSLYDEFKGISLVNNQQTVLLPSLVQKIFNRLFRNPGEPYLVGSTIHSLCYGGPLSEALDIDMVFALPEKKSFQVDGFNQCPHNTLLYTTKMDNQHIDCYVVPGERISFVEQNALTRDFTIGCLYVNYLGVIHDPTGNGLKDLKDKTLRTILPPEKSFQQGPVRLLRAIKWIVAGFTPVPELIDALNNWQPSPELKTSHLNAVARKHLMGFDEEQQNYYLEVLNKYQLGIKLFGTSTGKTTISLTQIKQQLNIIGKEGFNKTSSSFFKSPPLNIENKLSPYALLETTRLT